MTEHAADAERLADLRRWRDDNTNGTGTFVFLVGQIDARDATIARLQATIESEQEARRLVVSTETGRILETRPAAITGDTCPDCGGSVDDNEECAFIRGEHDDTRLYERPAASWEDAEREEHQPAPWCRDAWFVLTTVGDGEATTLHHGWTAICDAVLGVHYHEPDRDQRKEVMTWFLDWEEWSNAPDGFPWRWEKHHEDGSVFVWRITDAAALTAARLSGRAETAKLDEPVIASARELAACLPLSREWAHAPQVQGLRDALATRDAALKALPE